MNGTKLIVSHAPFWHDGDSLFQMNLNYIIALLPAALFGIVQFGGLALGVIAMAMSTAMLWELLINVVSKRKIPVGDLDAAVIGLLFGLMVPATMPWWVVAVGTLVAVILGKFVFGGIGANPFHPTLIGMAVLMMSWPAYFDFDAAYVAYEFDYTALAPLAALKFQGTSATELFPLADLFMGREVGGIGSTFGLGIVIGGIYLMLRGYTRWEVVVSFLAGILITGGLFYVINSEAYASPLFHLFSGYTLLGAFFLATESSSSPVNTIPMIMYGFLGGLMIILMRNIGVYADGTVIAILLINVINPLIDVIKPKTLGKGCPMREMISMIVVLTALTAVSGGLLAAVKSGTEVRIEEQILKFQKKPAIEQILTDVTNNPIGERFNVSADGVELQVFPGKLADGTKAVAFETKGKGGYGGDVGLMMGFNLATDEIIAARVTTHSETPGLGARAKDDPAFVSQFNGKPVADNLALKAEGGSIDAMSGATITSGAVSRAALEAQDLYKKLKPEIEKQIQ